MSFFEESDQREAALLKEYGPWTVPLALVASPFVALLGVPLVLWQACALYLIWTWYLTAIIGPASFWAVFGVLLAAQIFSRSPQRTSTPHESTKSALNNYLMPLILLELGWAGKLVAPHLPALPALPGILSNPGL